MICIGEKLNSSVPKTLEALKAGDEATLVALIQQQAAGGATYLDLNTALMGSEEEAWMLRLISLVKTHSDCGIMLDSPNPTVLIHCLPAAAGRPILVNSITLDRKYEALTWATANAGAGVVCLPMSDGKIPVQASGRILNVKVLVQKLLALGFPPDKILIDLLLESVATNPGAAQTSLETLKLLTTKELGVQSVCGLSNLSFGLPRRGDLNAAFLSMAIAAGLSHAILDVTSAPIQHALTCANAILGQDEYCLSYIGHCRSLL